jgi:hypothetical protein
VPVTRTRRQTLTTLDADDAFIALLIAAWMQVGTCHPRKRREPITSSGPCDGFATVRATRLEDESSG